MLRELSGTSLRLYGKAGVEGVISDDEAEAVAGGFRVAFQPVELELTEWQGDRNN